MHIHWFFKKSKRLHGLSTRARLSIGVGRNEQARHAKAIEDFFGRVNAVARTNEAYIDKCDVGLLALRELHRLIRRYRNADDHVTQALQQVL